jgi:CheY-like chemotaxis protein
VRLRQVLLNLTGNAVKFTPRGSVTVSIGIAPAGVPAPAAGEVVFSVADTGIGIPEQKQQLLFQKFSQGDSSTTRRFGGTGLGLAIAKHLVELMGGRIGVHSVPGAGSTFWFTLSAAKSPAGAPVATGVGLTASSAGKPGRTWPGVQVLVADDNEINQIVVEEMLARLGCAVTMVDSGAAVLERLAGGSFDLLLMDCRMPGMDGFAATKAIRDAEAGMRHLPIIAVTASALVGDRDECLAAGMDDYLTKPMQTADLERILERWAPHSPASTVTAGAP